MKAKVLLCSFVHPDLIPPVHQMAKSYQDEGFSVDVFSFGYSKSSNSSRKEGLIDYTTLAIYSGSFLRKIKFHYDYYKKVQQLKSNNKYELIVAFCPFSFFHASEVFGSDRVVLSCLEIYEFDRFKLSYEYLVFQYFLRHVNRCRGVFFPSLERSLYLYGKYKLSRKPGVILNTPFIAATHTVPKKKIKNRIKVLHSGGLTYSRGVLELLSGFKQLDKDKFLLYITNYGTDSFSVEVGNFVRNEGMDNVHLLPQVKREDLIKLQQECHIGICFIRRTGILDTDFIAPNKLGEYLLEGLQCVVSDQLYLKLLGDHKFIHSTDIDNPSDVARSIRQAAEMAAEPENDSPISAFVKDHYNMKTQLIQNKLIPN